MKKQLTKEEILEQVLEEIRNKLSSGWRIEAISTTRYSLEDKPNLYFELEIVQE